MKKLGIFLGVLIATLSAGVASASLYNYYAEQGLNLPSIEDRNAEATMCGIDHYIGSKTQNLALEACLRGELVVTKWEETENDGLLGGTVPKRPTEFKTNLAEQKTENHSDNTLKVTSITTKDGYTLDPSIMGDLIVLSVNPGASNAETVVCSSLTTSTKTFTGCVFGYRFDNPTATTSANIKGHSPGEPVIISNTDTYLSQQYLTLDGDATASGAYTWTATNTASGVWTFSQSPRVPTPLSSNLTYAASVEYVNAVATSGVADAYTNVAGKVEMATKAEAAAGTATGTTGAYLFLPSEYASSTGGVATTTIPITDTNGKLNANFGGSASTVATLDSNTLVVQNPANATSTPTAGKIPMAQSTKTLLNPSWIASTTATTGSLIYYNGTDYQNLGVGSTGQFIVSSSSIPYWGFYTLMSTSTATSSDYLKVSADTMREQGSSTYSKIKEIVVGVQGSIMTYFELCESGDGVGKAYGAIYINGASITEFTENVASCVYVPKTYKLPKVYPGDLIQIYAKHDDDGGPGSARVQNFRLYWADVASYPQNIVITD